ATTMDIQEPLLELHPIRRRHESRRILDRRIDCKVLFERDFPGCFERHAMSPSTLILALGLEAERHLAVHGSHRVPVHADVPAHRIDVAPCALNRMSEIETLSARRRIERLRRANRKRYGECLSEPAFDAF